MQKDYSHVIKFIPQLESVEPDKARALVDGEFMPACYEPDITDHDYFNTLEAAGLGDGKAWCADVESLGLEATVAMLTFILRADHFADGALFEQFENGYLLRVLRRLAALVQPARRRPGNSSPNIIPFWHERERNGYLSNWYESPFEFCGREFRTAEHWMMWQKACMFAGFGKADEILQAPTPKAVKALGREITPFDAKKWGAASSQLVIYGLRHKFAQNMALRNALLSTGSAVLAEASPYDKIWGIGLAPDDPRVGNPGEWQGENLLGRALMTVRSDLRVLDRLGGGADWREVRLDRLQVWDMTLLELARNPVTRPAALAYAWGVSASMPDMFADARAVLHKLDWTVGGIKEAMARNMGGGLMPNGYHELFDDLRFQAALGWL